MGLRLELGVRAHRRLHFSPLCDPQILNLPGVFSGRPLDGSHIVNRGAASDGASVRSGAETARGGLGTVHESMRLSVRPPNGSEARTCSMIDPIIFNQRPDVFLFLWCILIYFCYYFISHHVSKLMPSNDNQKYYQYVWSLISVKFYAYWLCIVWTLYSWLSRICITDWLHRPLLHCNVQCFFFICFLNMFLYVVLYVCMYFCGCLSDVIINDDKL